MTPFTSLRSRVAVLPQANIDTDQILPASRMKGLTRTGLGVWLFEGARYHPDGRPNTAFVLNTPAGRDAQILVTGANFGCGSSREHAVWALADHGIRCILAPSFGMIFEANCARNGLLLVPLADDRLAQVAAAADAEITVDLRRCNIALPGGTILPFTVKQQLRRRLLAGQDDIDRTLAHADAITRYEAAASAG